VISKTGFEKYTGINIAYANQVIATRKQGMVSRADSIQARKNVLEMIRMAKKMETDSVNIREVKPLERNTLTEQSLRVMTFRKKRKMINKPAIKFNNNNKSN
jgi:hypothetical protein